MIWERVPRTGSFESAPPPSERVPPQKKICNNSEELAIQKANVEESDTAWSTVSKKSKNNKQLSKF